MRSASFLGTLAGLYACFGGACAPQYEGEDQLVDRGEANTIPPRDAGGRGGGSSSGSLPPRDSGNTPSLDGAIEDAGSQPSGPCDPSKGIGPLGDMPGLVNTDYRTGARLTPDELEVVFLQVRNPEAESSPYDGYVASRATLGQPFGAPRKIDAIGAVFNVSLGADGLSLYFTPRDTNGANGVQISTRAARDAMFAGAAVVSGVPGWSYSPFVTADGALLFSQYPESSPSTILRGALAGGGIGAASPFFAAGGNDIDYPTLSSDGTELFYSEYLAPPNGAFRRAVRSGGSFVPTPLPGIDDANHEVTWVSADACRVYVTDWRSYTLKVAQRLP